MYPEIILCVIALLWSGMVLGISFLDNWIKFKTPSLDRNTALDLGRTVFRTFHFVQGILLIMLLLAGITSYFLPRYWLYLSSVTLILAIQVLIFFPRLNKRVSLIMAGDTPAHSRDHAYYGALEIFKFFILLIFGIMILISLCSLE